MLFFGRKKRLLDYASGASGADHALPLPADVAEVLGGVPRPSDPALLSGGELLGDAGVYRLTDELALVQSLSYTSPMVENAYVYGQIAAAHAFSAVYARGGSPRTALNLVGYPNDKDPGLTWLSDVLKGGAERCQRAGAALVGGRATRAAEIRYGLAVTGVLHPHKALTRADARPGDRLVLTKALGTGVATTAHKAGECGKGDEAFEAACAGMVQLNEAAREAMAEVGVHAAADVAGSGLAGCGWAVAEASRATLAFELGRLPLLPGAEALARRRFLARDNAVNAKLVAAALRLEGKPDPVRLEFFYDPQTSGGLLISVPAERADALVKAVRDRGADAGCVVGEVLERQDRALVLRA
jgi:selenide,water dikinase